MRIDAKGIHYRELNEKIRKALAGGAKEISLEGVNGQRFICSGMSGDFRVKISGVPGNDLGSFMSGPTITVEGNGEDAIGNTMNDGKIIVNGFAGDVLAYGMRGGKLFVRDNGGYRVGIHMKAYDSKSPTVVIGGSAGDFLGEYMAGGTIILLGLNENDGGEIAGRYLGTGMHGGTIYLRKRPSDHLLGEGVKLSHITSHDREVIEKDVREFCGHFGKNPDDVLNADFVKLVPNSHRPYKNVYCY